MTRKTASKKGGPEKTPTKSKVKEAGKKRDAPAAGAKADGQDPALAKLAAKIDRLAHPAALILLCLLFCLGLRYYSAHFYAKGPDNFQYLALAKDVASGDYFRSGFDLDKGLINSRRVVPLYPALIAAGIKMGADPENFGTWVSILLGGLTAVPLFLLGLKMGNKWCALFACLFFGILPLSTRYTGQILTEDAYTFLTVLTVLSLFHFLEKPSWPRGAAVGALCALSYLTRDVGFGYIFLALAAAAYWAVNNGAEKESWKKIGLAGGAAALAFVLVSAPFWVFVKVHTGKLRPTLRMVEYFQADLMGYAKGTGPRDVEAASQADKDKWERESFSLFKTVSKTISLVIDYNREASKFVPFTFYPLALLGLLFIPIREKPRMPQEISLIVFVLSVMVAYALVTPYVVDARYYLQAMALATLWAGRGAAMAPAWAGRRAGKIGPYALGAALVAVLAATGYFIVEGAKDAAFTRYFYSMRNFAGKTVSGHRESMEDARKILDIPAGKRVAARKPYAAYYLDGLHVDIAPTVDGVREQVQRGECDYVFIGSTSVQRYRPDLKELVTDPDPLPGAPLVYRRYYPKYHKLFSLYQVGGKPIRADLGSDPTNVMAMLQKADEYYNAGYLEHARQLYEMMKRQNIRNARAIYGLFQVYAIYGSLDGRSIEKARQELELLSALGQNEEILKKAATDLDQAKASHDHFWRKR